MTTILVNGVATAVPAGAIAWKYADPLEDGRFIYAGEEDYLRRVRGEDPTLIVDVAQPTEADYQAVDRAVCAILEERYPGTRWRPGGASTEAT